MTKINAYQCDLCGKIYNSEDNPFEVEKLSEVSLYSVDIFDGKNENLKYNYDHVCLKCRKILIDAIECAIEQIRTE